MMYERCRFLHHALGYELELAVNVDELEPLVQMQMDWVFFFLQPDLNQYCVPVCVCI